MLKKIKAKLLVTVFGGAGTPVLSASAGAATETAQRLGCRIYGAWHGLQGILNEDFGDLTALDPSILEKLMRTTYAALGTARDKPTDEDGVKIARVLQAHGADGLIYFGGNDTAEKINIISKAAASIGSSMSMIHGIKTVDWDVPENIFTPGSLSAVRYIAKEVRWNSGDNWSMQGVLIIVVMGRNAGWLAGSAARARRRPDQGPHLIYCPEVDFYESRFLSDVKAMYERYGHCLVVVSEGIHDKDGTLIAEKDAAALARDAHNNAVLSGSGLDQRLCSLVQSGLGIKRVRALTLGAGTRSHDDVAPIDLAAARGVGQKAVEYALAGRTGSVVVKDFHSNPSGGFRLEYDLVPLELVADKTKVMPRRYINEAGNHVTDAYLEFLRPLVGLELPEDFQLRDHVKPVRKLLTN